MNRRELFKRVGMGLIGAYAAVNLPISWLPEQVKMVGTQAYLDKAFKTFTKYNGCMPMFIQVSQEFFEAYEGELQPIQRFTTSDHDAEMRYEPTLAFRCARVTINPSFQGWDYAIGARYES